MCAPASALANLPRRGYFSPLASPAATGRMTYSGSLPLTTSDQIEKVLPLAPRWHN